MGLCAGFGRFRSGPFFALLLCACGSPQPLAPSPAGPPSAASGSAAGSHPFGSHALVYAPGSILPSHLTRAQLDEATRSFYAKWKGRYLRSGCGDGRYYVWSQGVVEPGAIAVSEGMGYGMMIAAYVAGADSDAHAIFDGLYRFVRDHPSASSPYLMAWVQVADCSTAPDNSGPASDGDLDIAFALLLADRQWGSGGTINYRQEALSTIREILAHEINPSTYFVHIGDPAILPSHADGTRSSDWMPGHFRAFASASGDSAWSRVVDKSYELLAAVQHPGTGLVPDFVINPSTAPVPAGPNWLEGPYDGDYYFNACRDPWRIGADYLVSGDPRARAALTRLNAWIRSKTGENPTSISNGYLLAGNPIDGGDVPEMPFVAPLGVSAMADASNQQWLNAVWDMAAGRELNDQDGYFGHTLQMLCLIVMSGNYWVP